MTMCIYCVYSKNKTSGFHYAKGYRWGCKNGREGEAVGMCVHVCYSDLFYVQLMMPVFWASEEGTLSKSDANKFKLEVYGAKYGIEAAVWGSVGIGGVCVCVRVRVRVHVRARACVCACVYACVSLLLLWQVLCF